MVRIVIGAVVVVCLSGCRYLDEELMMEDEAWEQALGDEVYLGGFGYGGYNGSFGGYACGTRVTTRRAGLPSYGVSEAAVGSFTVSGELGEVEEDWEDVVAGVDVALHEGAATEGEEVTLSGPAAVYYELLDSRNAAIAATY